MIARILGWAVAALAVALMSVLSVAVYNGSTEAQTGGPLPVETLVIGIDLSTSNPMTRDPNFAAKVANWLRPRILNMGPKSLVFMRTFGSYDASQNQMKVDRKISAKRNTPADIADLVTGIVAGVPQLIANRRLQAQNQTNIVAFLDNVSKLVSCGPGKQPVTVVLASDGIEDSELGNLAGRGGALPIPSQPLFKDCKALIILGLGQGTRSPAKTRELFEQWQAYAKAAGFQEFQGLNDW